MRPFLSSLLQMLRPVPQQLSVQDACRKNATAERKFERALQDWTASTFDDVIGAFIDDHKRPHRGD